MEGRSDDIVKIEGKRVSLLAVEEALKGLSEIEAVSATVLSGRQDRLAAAVTLSQKGRSALAELGPFRLTRQFRKALGLASEPAFIPRVWRFVDDLPSRPMGKRDRSAIADLFSENS